MTESVRPWYKWHWLTVLVCAIVVGGLLARQLEKRSVFGITNLGILNEWSDFGWPLAYLHLAESRWYVSSSISSTANYEWHLWRMSFNAAFSALLTVGAVFATERWTRNKRRLQFSIEGILCLTAMTGGLIVLGREWELPYRDFDPENVSVYWSVVSLNDLVHPLRWPSLIALAIALYLAASLLLRTVDWRTAEWLGR
jgi:hypothetical protein